MHSSDHSKALASHANDTAKHHASLRALIEHAIGALAPIDRHYRDIQDSLTLARMSEANDLTRAQLERIPPFLDGVSTEMVAARGSLVRLVTIASELESAMTRLTAFVDQPSVGRTFSDREEIAIRKGPGATAEEIAAAFGVSVEQLRSTVLASSTSPTVQESGAIVS